MEACTKFDHNGIRYPAYVPLADQHVEIELAPLLHFLDKFAKELALPVDDICCDFVSLSQIVVRVDQRKLHYKMYHNGTMLNELKEVALYAYWITKYKPLTYNNRGTTELNEVFSVYLVYTVVKNYLAKMEKDMPAFSEDFNRDIIYSLRYRIHSYDSVVALVEAIAQVP